MGDAFEDMFYCARRLANFVSKGFDESALAETVWVNQRFAVMTATTRYRSGEAIAAAVKAFRA